MLRGSFTLSHTAMALHSQYTCSSVKTSRRLLSTPSWYVHPRVAHAELRIVVRGSCIVETKVNSPSILLGGSGLSGLSRGVIEFFSTRGSPLDVSIPSLSAS